MDSVIQYVRRYQYLAMFGILVLCGLGLPIPEEVTLVASGFAVGWEWADSYLKACLACTAGILVGDSIIFFIGHYLGKRFFNSRFVRILLPRKRQARVRRAFYRHGKKTVFFARFLAGIRIGVYAYAGQHGMRWSRFLFLDFLGCVVSVPTSVWVGQYVAQKLADPEEAEKYALEIIDEGHEWLYVIVSVLAVSFVLHFLWNIWRDRRVAKKMDSRETSPDSASSPVSSPESAPRSEAGDSTVRDTSLSQSTEE